LAIAVYFHPKQMTLAQFEESHRRLTGAGSAEPEGRIHHSCFGEDGEKMVHDVWESPEAFEAFGAVLVPILAEVGIDPGDPSVMELHRLQQSSTRLGTVT
jgi:hypothetical protein